MLEWQPPPGDAPVDYVVVRRDGDAPAGRVEEGVIVETTTQMRYLDRQVAAGQRYTYAVFTRAGGLYSRSGAAAPAVDILAEISNFTAKVGNGTVELAWTQPPNVSDVLIRRSLSPPRDHTDGALVKQTGAGHAKDEGLRNGQRYHYLACCIYRPAGAAEVASPGIRLAVVPEQMPEAVENFQVRAQGLEVLCEWTPPAYGQVVVARSAKAPGLTVGQRLTADEVSALGERVVTLEGGRAVDAHPDINQPYYSVFTIAGPHAITGGTRAIVVCADVTDLQLWATREGITLRWTWPPECRAVTVARRAETWPEGPDDPQAVCVSHSRIEYMAAGEKFVDKIEEGRGKFYFVVYAQAMGAPGQFFAPGNDPGCRAAIQWERWMTLRYRLSSLRKGKEMRLTWSVEDPFPNFAGFVLVASQSGIPVSPDDGVEIFRWVPEAGKVAGSHEAGVSLEPVQQRRWARFFCKALTLDPAQRHTTLIIHPDVCQPISSAGEMDVNAVGEKGRYQAGVPETIICPYCFEEFPVEQMLFDSYSGGEAMPGRYGPLERMLGRPLTPPKNKRGQWLTRKLCPKDPNHILPVTAGSQTSLVIGIIGAKFSGKSHYIASLIERLENQVGADLQTALLPVTDETRERYRREFYNPLFGKGLVLPLTVGTPPPLIYDLTLDGKLWGEKRNRAITLALYDTAGENLQDATTARQMVQYLRVASGLIFLVDPLQVPSVREALPPSVQPPPLDQDAAPNQIMANVLQLLENGAVLNSNAPLSIPVAVALTKCDVLRDAGLIDTNRLWNMDKRHIGYFDVEAHEDMSGMMGEYVQRWSMAAHSTVQRRFSRHAFFGLSATGCAPDPHTGRYKFISPWRVEDPLLWLLAELGVIPAR
jgi:hypothetical protein